MYYFASSAFKILSLVSRVIMLYFEFWEFYTICSLLSFLKLYIYVFYHILEVLAFKSSLQIYKLLHLNKYNRLFIYYV